MHTNRGRKHNADQPVDVWNKFVSGNTICFEKVFTRYYKQMYGYGLKLCNQPELVEDCIQELFQTIWERRKELTHIDSPNVYLFVSLRRSILRQLKQQDKFKDRLDTVDESTAIRFGMEEIIIRDESKREQQKALHEALNQLSSRQKEVLYLHFYNGMSYGEIEQILSINRQSVRNYMYRAMETLRTILDTEVMKLVISLMLSFLPFLA